MPKSKGKQHDGNCPSTKLIKGKREKCIENRGHSPPHRDILGHKWK